MAILTVPVRRPLDAGCVVLLALSLAGWLAACGGGGTAPLEPPPSQPSTPASVSIISGGGAVDSAFAFLATPLVVEVRASGGRVVAGTSVIFTGLSAVPDGPTTAYVSDPAVQVPRTDARLSVLTDGNGRATIRVRLGLTAGPARVLVSAPAFQVTDTARYTVRAGQPATVRFAQSLAVLSAGDSTPVSAVVRDRWGNARPEAVSLRVLTPGATLSAGGRLLAPAPAVHRVEATGAGFADSMTAIVVPRATIAFHDQGGGTVVMALDGREPRTIATGAGNCCEAPAWEPGGQALLLAGGDGLARGQVQRVPLTAPGAPFLTGNGAPAQQAWPRVAEAAPLVVYTGSGDGTTPRPWTSDASGAGSAPLPGLPAGAAWRATPSPDGTLIALVLGDSIAAGGQVRVYERGTQALRAWAIAGDAPAFSPDGTRIAYVDRATRRLAVVAPDGTGAMAVSPPGRSYDPLAAVSWSRDGQWLYAATADGVEMVRRSDALVLPLPHLPGVRAVSERP
ncbi:MAG: hypothetical protein NW201_05025 [Gemmatimonadales bacterium]|nr:hypothetical protein [Gemmatimonadales bacterium]